MKEVEFDESRLGELKTVHVFTLNNAVFQVLAAYYYAKENGILPAEIFGISESLALTRLESTAKAFCRLWKVDLDEELARSRSIRRTMEHFNSLCLIHGFTKIEALFKPDSKV